MMPSPYSSRSSIDDSVELGKRLGMNVIERPITEAFHVLLKELNFTPSAADKNTHAAENLQSRLRGNILMSISNDEGGCCSRPVISRSWHSGIAHCMEIPTEAWP